MTTTDRDYADVKPRDAADFLDSVAIVFITVAAGAVLGIIGYGITLLVFSL